MKRLLGNPRVFVSSCLSRFIVRHALHGMPESCVEWHHHGRYNVTRFILVVCALCNPGTVQAWKRAFTCTECQRSNSFHSSLLYRRFLSFSLLSSIFGINIYLPYRILSFCIFPFFGSVSRQSVKKMATMPFLLFLQKWALANKVALAEESRSSFLSYSLTAVRQALFSAAKAAAAAAVRCGDRNIARAACRSFSGLLEWLLEDINLNFLANSISYGGRAEANGCFLLERFFSLFAQQTHSWFGCVFFVRPVEKFHAENIFTRQELLVDATQQQVAKFTCNSDKLSNRRPMIVRGSWFDLQGMVFFCLSIFKEEESK